MVFLVSLSLSHLDFGKRKGCSTALAQVFLKWWFGVVVWGFEPKPPIGWKPAMFLGHTEFRGIALAFLLSHGWLWAMRSPLRASEAVGFGEL